MIQLLLLLGFTFDGSFGNLTSAALYYYIHLPLVGVNKPHSDSTKLSSYRRRKRLHFIKNSPKAEVENYS